ncbi:hypothetical protein [Enterococcus sp. BWR-S5]|uniref:hypothetical protein n=1 Tax=Enterococcus sp. BWR-S5 TaxID=2787714 RepID=UPI001923C32E|nr:hypothetical protein [Enterococcus sp. BWR-S5]MBL1224887.1 hypothetical protein [Enterococcus sp. BWR-S5]
MNSIKKTLIILFGLLLVASGCSEKDKEEERNDLSKSDQALLATVKRERKFSDYRLQNVGKEEAEVAVKDKLQLEIPEFVENIQEISLGHLEENEALAVDSTFYSVSSQSLEAAYTVSTVMRDKENLYPIYSISQIDYSYHPDKEVAYIEMYKMEIINSESTGTYNGGELQEYLLALGKAAEIAEEDIAGEIELLAAKSNEELKNQYVVLYDTFGKAEEKGSLGKRLRIAYGESGIPVKIQLYVKDYHY